MTRKHHNFVKGAILKRRPHEEGGRGFPKKQTNADEGGRGVRPMRTSTITFLRCCLMEKSKARGAMIALLKCLRMPILK